MGRVDLERILSAADTVLDNAFIRARPLVVGYHGGCEPLLDLRLVDELTVRLRRRAARRGLSVEFFATTSGVLPGPILKWIVDNLTGLTISWDGNRAAHDAQRPRRDGSGSYDDVMRTVDTVDGRLKFVRLRVTVTRDSCDGLLGAVTDLSQRLRGEAVFQLEPVFHGLAGAGYPSLSPSPERFFEMFARAWMALSRTGCRLELAGSRLSQIHGRHCPIWQQNLSVDEQGSPVACFLPSSFETTRYVLGGTSPRHDASFVELCELTSRDLDECRACFARDHCARQCPHVCPVAGAARVVSGDASAQRDHTADIDADWNRRVADGCDNPGPNGPATLDPGWCRAIRQVLALQLLQRAGQPIDQTVLESLSAISLAPDRRWMV